MKQSEPTAPLAMDHLLPARVAYAKQKFHNTRHQQDNDRVETYYYAMLQKLKGLLTGDTNMVFEKLYSQANNQNSFSMHAYVTSTFYLYLECDEFHKYKVDFSFRDCKQEATIRDLLNNEALHGHTREVDLIPDFSSFYYEVLTYKLSSLV